MKHSVSKQILDIVAELNLIDAQVYDSRRGHPRLKATAPNGQKILYIFSNSPSCYHAMKNARAQIRRLAQS